MEESASERFRKRLRELRQACRWTQEKAAESCDLGYKVYQLYELGIKANPGLLTLEKIAKGFGLEIHELLAPAPSPRAAAGKRPAAARGKRAIKKGQGRKPR